MDSKELFLFVLGMIIFYAIGYFSRSFIRKRGNDLTEGFGTVEGSLLALFAFFLGFTFSITANKVETIRTSSVNEANAIGTAINRSSLFGAENSQTYKGLFKSFLGARLEDLSEEVKTKSHVSNPETEVKANQIWEHTWQLFESGEHVEASRLMIPALNDMFDSISKRDADVSSRLPHAILWMLYFLSFCSCFIVGFTMDGVIWTNIIGFIYILIIAITVSLIIDASNPLEGLINTNRANLLISQIYESL